MGWKYVSQTMVDVLFRLLFPTRMASLQTLCWVLTTLPSMPTPSTLSDYGSSVGRYANRIKNGQFALGEDTIQLKKNDGPNCLHGGGNTEMMHQVYDAEQIGDSILKLTMWLQMERTDS